MKKILLFGLVLVSLFQIGFPYTNISTCQTINPSFSWFDSEREIKLNGTISNHDGDCITINTSNIILNCVGNSIGGDGGMFGVGIEIVDASSNITIKNCEITRFGVGINAPGAFPSPTDLSFVNINFSFSSGIDVFYSFNSNFSNILFENITGTGIDFMGINVTMDKLTFKNVSNRGIYTLSAINYTLKNSSFIDVQGSFGVVWLQDVTNSYFYNLSFLDVSNGVYLRSSTYNNNFDTITLINLGGHAFEGYNAPYNNNFTNIYVENAGSEPFSFKNSDSNIVKDSVFINTSYITVDGDNNIFYNNSISADPPFTSFSDWSGVTGNVFNYSGIGNYYTNVTSNPFCFDTGDTVCDYLAQNISALYSTSSNQPSSLFPIYGTFSSIVLFLSLFFFFLL